MTSSFVRNSIFKVAIVLLSITEFLKIDKLRLGLVVKIQLGPLSLPIAKPEMTSGKIAVPILHWDSMVDKVRFRRQKPICSTIKVALSAFPKIG